MKKLLKTLIGFILIASLIGGVFVFYSLNSTHAMAYGIRKKIGISSQSWNSDLVSSYAELRLATKRLGQRAPKAQATRLAILKNYNFTPDSYEKAVQTLKDDYRSWNDFQAAVVKKFQDLEKNIRTNAKQKLKRRKNVEKMDRDDSIKTKRPNAIQSQLRSSSPFNPKYKLPTPMEEVK
jgi:hypothetical protein